MKRFYHKPHEPVVSYRLIVRVGSCRTGGSKFVVINSYILPGTKP